MARIEKVIEVKAPLERCYQLWSHFEGFPQFMENIKEIRPKGEKNIWHWIIKGPVGDVGFDVEVDALKPNQLVSWHTVRDADVSHSGAVTFQELDNRLTRIHVVLEYQPPAGKVGEFVADLLKNPEQMVDTDLNRFKVIAEQVQPGAPTSYQGGTPQTDI